MGGFKITTNRQPSDLQELVSKGYVDQKVSAISSPDLAGFIKKDGSIKMESNFDLNNLKKATNNSDSVNLEQLTEATSVLATNVSKSYIKKEGTTLLTGNLNHKITNLQKGTNQNDAVNINN